MIFWMLNLNIWTKESNHFNPHSKLFVPFLQLCQLKKHVPTWLQVHWLIFNKQNIPKKSYFNTKIKIKFNQLLNGDYMVINEVIFKKLTTPQLNNSLTYMRWLESKVIHFQWIHHPLKIHTIVLKWKFTMISVLK